MPRVADFDPQWIDLGDRRGIGFTMKCPARHCTGRIWCLFSNPLDGGPAYERDCVQLMFGHYQRAQDAQRDGPILDRGCGKARWHRVGETFETLSLSPSLQMWDCGHIVITNGGW